MRYLWKGKDQDNISTRFLKTADLNHTHGHALKFVKPRQNRMNTTIVGAYKMNYLWKGKIQ